MEFTEKQIETLVRAAEKGLTGDRVQVYEEIWFDLTATTSTRTKDFTRCPTGKIRVITHMAALNSVTSCTFIKLCHINGGQTAIDKVGVAPLIGETVNWDGFIILGEGDYAEVQWLGCTSGDDTYAVVSGYEITK